MHRMVDAAYCIQEATTNHGLFCYVLQYQQQHQFTTCVVT